MNRYRLDLLRKQLKPFRLYFYSRLRSTNDHAARLRKEGKLYAPAIILAGHQIAGRGRGNNSWWSGRGSITATFVIPADAGISPHRVPLIAGLAIHRALTLLTGCGSLKLKWPNDLWHDDLKLAGLLCERVKGADLIGVGLNVNVDLTDIPSSLRHKVSSLRAVAGRQIELQTVLTAISVEINKLLLKKQFASFGELLPEYGRVDALAGRNVRVTNPGEAPIQGVCDGLDAEGRLLVRTSGKPARIVTGHVELS